MKQDTSEELKLSFRPEEAQEEDRFLPSRLAASLLRYERENNGRLWQWVPERGQFFTYHQDKGVWEPIQDSYLKKVCRDFLRQTNEEWDRSRHTREVFKAIKAHLTHPANKQRFDPGKDPNLELINTQNGMVDWREGKLLDHRPEYFSLFQLPVAYRPDADCPRWQKALKEWIPDANTRKFLQEYIGYCLIPDTSRHKAVILYGSGRNGKSTFLETLAAMFGENNLAHIELSRLSNRFETAHLKDKLVNICADLDPTYLRRTGIIKTIVAGEPLRGEHKFKPSFDFTPVVRLLFSANELPQAKDKSTAWYRRFELVHFPNEFKPGDDNYDRYLQERLTEELSGILNWALEGLRRLNTQDKFTTSKELKRSKRAYKHQNDSILAFLEERVTKAKGNVLPKRTLYKRYRKFCKESGLSKVSLQKFSRRVRDSFGFKTSRKMAQFCLPHGNYDCPQCSPDEKVTKRVRCWLNIDVH